MSEKIVVCLEKGGARDMAEAFSRRTNTPISEKPGEHLTVLFNSKGVSLTGYGLAYQGDFENMLHRVTNGRLQHEMLVRASKSEKPGRKAIDATAGMGEDGFLPQKSKRKAKKCTKSVRGAVQTVKLLLY